MRRELRSEDQGEASDVGGWGGGSNGDGTQAPAAGLGSGRPDELTCQDALPNAALPVRMESTWSPVHEVGNGVQMCSSRELVRAHARRPTSVDVCDCLSDVCPCLSCPCSSIFVFAPKILISLPHSLLLNPCTGFWFGGRSAGEGGDQLR